MSVYIGSSPPYQGRREQQLLHLTSESKSLVKICFQGSPSPDCHHPASFTGSSRDPQCSVVEFSTSHITNIRMTLYN